MSTMPPEMTELERVDALIAALRTYLDDPGNREAVREQYKDVVSTIPYVNIERSKWELIDRLRNDKILMPCEKTPFNYYKS